MKGYFSLKLYIGPDVHLCSKSTVNLKENLNFSGYRNCINKLYQYHEINKLLTPPPSSPSTGTD